MALLKDKVIIVTGSSSGIGLATAKLAVEEGAKVLGIDVSAAPEALGNLPTTDFQFLQIDLTKADAPSTVVSNAVETFGGRIDALLNVAGVMDNNASADSVSDDMWDRCIAINLTAPVKLMREVLVVMKEQKSGSIVNVGSKASVTGAAAGVAYTASKHGLVGATKNVAWRFKGDGIRCNAVLPGGVMTNIVQSVDMTKFDREASAALKPIQDAHIQGAAGLPLQPDEIAKTIVFLASENARYISGALVPVDLGWSTI